MADVSHILNMLQVQPLKGRRREEEGGRREEEGGGRREEGGGRREEGGAPMGDV
jgi:hypothetical protein